MPAIPQDVREKLVALGGKIKRLREQFKLSRQSLAESVENRLANIGCRRIQTAGMISGIERGRTFMSVREVRAMAYVLGDDSIGDEYETLKKESGQ